MEYIKDFFLNYVLISAVLGWFIAQFLKIFTSWGSTKKIHIKNMLANGGMPSSHSSTVLALTTACAVQEGLSSPYFAICAVVSMIVMNDAFGVRYETGEQAKIINRITKELFSGKPEEINTGLKELVGHTPFQVLMGALLGIVVALGYGWIVGAL
ncbi:MAG: divergent PAP2 family protein [Ruminococcaceae bacterium]|nr:divergent PAP2 family protein [Oscillospiraceae bacterium]